ncbi:prepilin peptidase [Nocardioides dubius]|uniref:A24 family peptidase n=1 Tax=Nocardioides dubius TaxID=317019 RepID=A0ABP4EKB2_9ACTN
MTETELLRLILTVFGGLLGLAVGSFLNVVVHRVPLGLSVVSPGSHCPNCQSAVRARHNVPVLGWLMLRGRCFDCHLPISSRYPLVEAGTGLVFALVALRFADTPLALPAYWAFAALGIALSLIDVDVRRLPNALVVPAYPILAALLVVAAAPGAGLRALFGASALFAIFFAIAVAAPGSMGFGDVKLAGVVGAMTAWLSWGTLLVGAFLAFVFGALVGITLIAARGADRRTAVPFGPFLVLGAWTAILGAGYLGDAYLAVLAA